MKVYIGYDSREQAAYDVAVYSLRRHCYEVLQVTPLDISRLESQGAMTRERSLRGGQMYDEISDAPMSTQFANSRFLTPILAQSGWALFTDSDVVFMDNVTKLLDIVDGSKAVYVVKHRHEGGEGLKMDGQIQTKYPRKNWSSVMLFNCDHPSNQRLTLKMINSLPGRNLHAFCWLEDEEIGELPAQWNWLVGVQGKPLNPKIAHFTLGGPWLHNWESREHDEIWDAEATRYRASK